MRISSAIGIGGHEEEERGRRGREEMKKTCGAGRGVHLFVKFMNTGISMRICHFFSFLIIF